MDSHYLTPLFAPSSVAVIGANERPDSAGRILFENLLASGFKGAVFPVNPRHQTVLGRPCYASIKDLEKPVDLAVIATPARTVPEIVEQCGRKKVRAAVVVSSGFTDESGKPTPLMNLVLNNAKLTTCASWGPTAWG